MKKKLILGYVRVSTDEQELSAARQADAAERRAVYINEGPCLEPMCSYRTFADPDTSGSLKFMDRPEARALFTLAQEGAANGWDISVIVPTLDRIGRNAVDVCQTVLAFEELKATVVFLDLNVDTRSPIGKFMLTVMAAFAQMELARIKERISWALAQKRVNSEVVGSLSYGWDAVLTGETRKKINKDVAIRVRVDNPEEQRWLRQMLEWKAGGMTTDWIAAELNRRGVPSKKAGKTIICKGGVPKLCSGRWSNNSVTTVLNSVTVREWVEEKQKAES